MDDHIAISASVRPEIASNSCSSFDSDGVWAPRLEIEPEVSAPWSLLKRTLDLVGGVTLLMLLSPLLLLIWVLIARSGGRPIFSQQRIGRYGRNFRCYKFRSMVPNAEAVLRDVLRNNPEMQAEWDSDEKLRCDPRVTSVGSFLRKTSLDELPQLLNVIKGDMSLVGPRPVYERDMLRYGRRGARWYLAVRPGMTGLWQVSGRNDVSFRRRVALDIYYVRSQSFGLDFQILIRTIRVVVKGTGY